MQDRRLPRLLTAIQEEEALLGCDRRTRGEAGSEGAPEGASERVAAMQRMSEPLDPAFRKQLTALLLRPEGEQGDVISLADRKARSTPTGRGRRSVQVAIGVALAAGVAAIALPRFLMNGQAPEYSLEVAERNSALLGAPSPAPEGAVRVHRGACIELTLRPISQHERTLNTSVLLVPKSGSAPLAWPITLRQTDGGLLRQEGPCATLPSAAGSGEWNIVVAYGQQLPSQEELMQSLAAQSLARAGARAWAAVQKPLQITD